MKSEFYINKYISDGTVVSETFEDETDAKIASRKGDSKFNKPYSHTLVFEKKHEGVSKFVKEVKY